MIAFRPVSLQDAEERMFVVSTWSASYKKSYAAGMIWTDDWADIMHRQIGRVLDLPVSRTVLAFEKQDPTFLYGWISGDTSEAMPIVYYVYVKEPYRRSGYARKLFAALGVDPQKPFTYVGDTPIARKLKGKIPMARWNPLEVRYPKEARRNEWNR